MDYEEAFWHCALLKIILSHNFFLEQFITAIENIKF